MIGGEALQRPDGDRPELFTDQAGILAEQFVLADAPADARKRALFADHIDRAFGVALSQAADEALDVDVQRAGIDASRLGALQAALRFHAHFALGKTQRDLVGGFCSNLRLKHGQHLPREFGVGFVGKRLSVHRLSL